MNYAILTDINVVFTTELRVLDFTFENMFTTFHNYVTDDSVLIWATET